MANDAKTRVIMHTHIFQIVRFFRRYHFHDLRGVPERVLILGHFLYTTQYIYAHMYQYLELVMYIYLNHIFMEYGSILLKMRDQMKSQSFV